MITLSEVEKAREILSEHLAPTPLIYSDYFTRRSGGEIYLKLENLQRAGSFKIRGALNKLIQCRDEIGQKGVIAASAGNHAQGVSLAARKLGLPATIVMPVNAAISKQLATRGYGGKIILEGENLGESIQVAREMEKEGYYFIHPYDDEKIVAGQGTIGFEILEQFPEVDQIWVPVGGGGLISGIALAVKEKNSQVEVMGVEAQACPSAQEARKEGRPLSIRPDQTVADGIAVPQVGDTNFPIIEKYVDEIFSVAEDEIYGAMVQLLDKKKLLAEGGAAVALAGVLAAEVEKIQEKNIVLVISGGNVDLNLLDHILRQGLIRSGRILRLQAVIRDEPGALVNLLNEMSQKKANILHIAHDRLGLDLPVGFTRVEVELETRGFEHQEDLLHTLKKHGYELEKTMP